MSTDVWVQVAVFTHDIDVGTGFVFRYVQRRLCPILVSSVGLSDIHEYSAG